ncbi:hypothetical protein EJ04DRAFT_578897 [Polyplosphaeria fusca]|uniref:F-box domain-containing protein n=1 Tax=Polyplosphaeria fusca TaxID=682080 RepID=A0A9P4QU92_9PLEO|nr:hypothetical protein EJ04DRAFT_578897 [Polyplosphaeria fusca]
MFLQPPGITDLSHQNLNGFHALYTAISIEKIKHNSELVNASTMASLLALPTEILLEIAAYLPRADLHRFRLTCKTLAKVGANILFETLLLFISQASLSPAMQQIQRTPELMECIRHLDLWMFDDSYQQAAIDFISGLPLLQGLNYDQPYGSNQSQILHSLFTAMAPKLSSLSRLQLKIRFGLDSEPHGFVEDEATIAIFQGVQYLNLNFEQYLDRWETAGKAWSGNEKYRHVLTRPCSEWISPHFTNIRHLILEFGSGWVTESGFAPKLDWRHTYFQHLRSLSLSHFLICHDWFTDWLAIHAATVEELNLAYCQILRVRDTNYTLDEEGYIACDPPRGGLGKTTYYLHTWARIFDLLNNDFHNLLSLKLTWFAGGLSEDENLDPSGDAVLTQGLYATCMGGKYQLMVQNRPATLAEDTMLLDDEASVRRLRERIGVQNVLLESVKELMERLPEIHTDSDEWYEMEDVLDHWSVDSQGNIFTHEPLPQPPEQNDWI